MTTAIRKPALPMPTRRANEIKNKLLHMLDEERTRKKKKKYLTLVIRNPLKYNHLIA